MKIILTVIAALILVAGCETQPKRVSYTLQDIMVIYENGYRKGSLNVLQNGGMSQDVFTADTAWFSNYIGELYK